jgi:hypothetical protein
MPPWVIRRTDDGNVRYLTMDGTWKADLVKAWLFESEAQALALGIRSELVDVVRVEG